MRRHSGLLGRLRSDRGGNVAILFALALVPLLGAVGVALDYARASSLRTELQSALDAAVLDVAQTATGQTAASLSQAVRQKLAARFDVGRLSNFDLAVANGAGSLSATASGDLPATIIEVLNITRITVGASSTALWGGQSLEIAMVLDNTGSMAEVLGGTSKIQALTTAAKNFVRYMQANIPASSSVKIAIVPFDTDVNIGTDNLNAPWLDTSLLGGATSGGWGGSGRGSSWNGCVWDRDQPNDVSNALPVAGNAPTLYGPDINRASTCELAPMQPLTTSWGALNSTISQMKASGATNLTIGLAWGLNLLTPDAPFPGAAPFGAQNVVKVVVMMTDGKNTLNRWTAVQSQIDPRTAQVCDNIKKAGVQIYAVATADADTSLLQSCASSASAYYTVTDGNQLDPVFQKIATQISKLRLSR